MAMLPLIVTGVMASVTMAGTIDTRSQPGHSCGTRDLSPEERMMFKRQRPQPDDNQLIELGAAMTFCCSGANCPSDNVAQNAVDQMNSFYKMCNIQFNLQNVSQTQDQRCQAGLQDNAAMDNLKSQVHTGNTSTLNIVYVNTNQGAGVKGVCVIPQPQTNIAQAVGSKDGCVVATDTLPKHNGGNDADGGGGAKKGRAGYSAVYSDVKKTMAAEAAAAVVTVTPAEPRLLLRTKRDTGSEKFTLGRAVAKGVARAAARSVALLAAPLVVGAYLLNAKMRETSWSPSRNRASSTLLTKSSATECDRLL
ncbi:Metallopeptidase, catalytic domain protein [Hirsutella rhossiliensis]|uniref:Metallopeptidase, catalytic domain protein n=1 Tax=Hirsutella rhossiliensis TaxID=111463 RepID=A0A9P8MVP5_9HYPO|nr:Metallopeptidase, catalytic domain protein [Hirsutella rhossiliensis]KAH0961274.1 Metallopeptidase, catalytic domain protein [Hirsutella rhossiliensis]